MVGRFILIVSLCCWVLVDLATCQKKLEEEEKEFRQLCQEERDLKLKYDDAPKGDQFRPFSNYLEIYRRRKALGKQVRQQFCPLELKSMTASAKPSEFSTPLTWNLEMTLKFGDLDLFNELCWHEFFTRRDLAATFSKSFRLQFDQEYELAKEKKKVLGKKLSKVCTSQLSRWPGRSEFGGNHRTAEEFFEHKCSEEAKCQFICERLQLASFSAEIERETYELGQMWCQRYQYTKWVRSGLCNDEQSGRQCCPSELAEMGKYDAIKLLAGTISSEAEQAVKDGVHYEKKDWFEFITALQDYAQSLKGKNLSPSKEQREVLNHVKKAKDQVAKALDIKTSWFG